MKRALVLLLVLLTTLVTSDLFAQCAVCGNPAFSAGDNDISRAFGDGAPKRLRLSAGVVYSYLPMSELYGGTKVEPPDTKLSYLGTKDWALRLHLMTLMAGVELPSGTAAQVVLPMGQAVSTKPDYDGLSATKDVDGQPIFDQSDLGVSDIEVRFRQRVGSLLKQLPSWMPQVVLSAGFAAPTGVFNVTGATGAVTDQYVSLGRGVWWALLDFDVFGQISDRVSWSFTNGVRLPVSEYSRESDGYRFTWGNEWRSALNANVVIVPGVLNASVGGEVQWRDVGLYDDKPDSSKMETYDNTGGLWVGVNPTVQAIIGSGFSATASLRIPVYRDVKGIQPVPALGAVLAINWSWDAASDEENAKSAPTPAILPGQAPKEALIANLLVPGKTTIIEYGATWCAVCKKLKPKLHAFADSREDVEVRYVDVTEWPVDKMRRYLPAQPGLPVLDIYGPDGKLIERTWGEKAMGYQQWVPKAKTRGEAKPKALQSVPDKTSKEPEPSA